MTVALGLGKFQVLAKYARIVRQPEVYYADSRLIKVLLTEPSINSTKVTCFTTEMRVLCWSAIEI